MKPYIELSKELVALSNKLMPATPAAGRQRLCPVRTELALIAYARGMELVIPTCEASSHGRDFDQYFKAKPTHIIDVIEWGLNKPENKHGYGIGHYASFTGNTDAVAVQSKFNAVVRDKAGDFYSETYLKGDTLKGKFSRPSAKAVEEFTQLKTNWKTLDLRDFYAKVINLEQQLNPTIAR